MSKCGGYQGRQTHEGMEMGRSTSMLSTSISQIGAVRRVINKTSAGMSVGDRLSVLAPSSPCVERIPKKDTISSFNTKFCLFSVIIRICLAELVKQTSLLSVFLHRSIRRVHVCSMWDNRRIVRSVPGRVGGVCSSMEGSRKDLEIRGSGGMSLVFRNSVIRSITQYP